MHKVRIFLCLLSIVSLMSGMGIYLLFRDMSTMLLFARLPKTGFTQTVCIPLEPSFFSDILKYNVPDMLWFVSGILLLRFIWFCNNKVQHIYVLCFYGIGFIVEISQLSEQVPGTFDLSDLFCMGIGAFVEGLLYTILVKRRLI